MDWRDFLNYLRAGRKLERVKSLEKTRDMAYAGRLAGADKQGFSRGMESLSRQLGKLDGSYERTRERNIREDRAALKMRFGKKDKEE